MHTTQDLLESFCKHQDGLRAEKMSAYMKHKFAFFGLNSPLRRELQKPFLQRDRLPQLVELPSLVRELWQKDERECQYYAIDLLRKYSKKVNASFIDLYEVLITQKSWWDTVDLIATSLVGDLFQNHPELITSKADLYIKSDNIWLQRTALLFQLKYREKTNFDRLSGYIKKVAHSNEFFIQKAIGWSLREYSKYEPWPVKTFIKNQQLSKLSVREGSKYL